MVFLSPVNDKTLQNLRNRYNELNWLSKLFFPSQMARLIQVHETSSYSQRYGRSWYHSEYQSNNIWQFCEYYQNFMTNTSVLGRFRRWLFDFLPEFNQSGLMRCWHFAQENVLGMDGFSLLASSDEHYDALCRGIILVKTCDLYNEILPGYLTDMVQFEYPEEYAQLLETLYHNGVVGYAQRHSSVFQTGVVLQYLSENVTSIRAISTIINSLGIWVNLNRQIDLETITTLYIKEVLEQFVNAVNDLYTKTYDAATNYSAIRLNPAYLRLLASHNSPEYISAGIVSLYKAGLCFANITGSEHETDLWATQIKYGLYGKKNANDIQTFGVNVMLLYHHPYPNKIANIICKIKKSIDFENIAKSLSDRQKQFLAMLPQAIESNKRARQKFFNKILFHHDILTDEKLMPLWEQIPDGSMGLLEIGGILRIFSHAKFMERNFGFPYENNRQDLLISYLKSLISANSERQQYLENTDENPFQSDLTSEKSPVVKHSARLSIFSETKNCVSPNLQHFMDLT